MLNSIGILISVPKNVLDDPDPAVHGCQVERRLLILILVVNVGAGIVESSHAVYVSHLGGHVDW